MNSESIFLLFFKYNTPAAPINNAINFISISAISDITRS